MAAADWELSSSQARLGQTRQDQTGQCRSGQFRTDQDRPGQVRTELNWTKPDKEAKEKFEKEAKEQAKREVKEKAEREAQEQVEKEAKETKKREVKRLKGKQLLHLNVENVREHKKMKEGYIKHEGLGVSTGLSSVEFQLVFGCDRTIYYKHINHNFVLCRFPSDWWISITPLDL